MEEREKQLITELANLYRTHEEGEAFITDNVSYITKNVIKRARKNYLGVYEEPYDPVTGDEKFWPPITEYSCDAVKKMLDLDLKNIQLFSTNASNPHMVKVYNAVLKEKLREAGFSEALNRLRDYLVIDGTGTLKFMDVYDKKLGRRKMVIKAVDNMNIVTDETAKDLHDAFGVFERALMTASEVRKMDSAWSNVDDLLENQPDTFMRATPNGIGPVNIRSSTPFYPIYEFWGQVKKSYITGKDSDDKDYVEGHIVIGNLMSENKAVILKKEENKKGARPYGETKVKEVIGRRLGRGIAEGLFGVQKYINMIMEIRRKNAQVLQNGLFKAKKSLGLEIDNILCKVSTGGIIPVDEQDDFMPMEIRDSRESNYRDESALIAWGERVSGANDVVRGDQAAMSAPATNALIKDRNARGLFELVQENMALMIKEFIEVHVLPWIIENVKDGEIIALTGSPQDLEEMDEARVERALIQSFRDYVNKHHVFPPREEVLAEKERLIKKLRSMGNQRFYRLKKGELSNDVGVNVTIDNEMFDRPAILSKLQEVLTLAVSSPGALNLDPQSILDVMFELMDIDTKRIKMNPKPYTSQIEKSLEQRKVEEAVQAQPRNQVIGKTAPQPRSRVPSGASPERAAAGGMSQLTPMPNV